MLTKEKLLETILATSYSKVDLHRRIRLWREYLEQAYFGKGKKQIIKSFLERESVTAQDRKAIESWGEEFAKSFTKETAYELTDILTESIKNLPLVNLYVPYEPTEKDVDRFGEWFRENIDKYILLDIHVDASTFGGCAFAVDGVYKDYSLRSRLAECTPQIHDILGKYVE